MRDVGVLLAAGELGIAVVLTHEQHRQFPQRGKIQRLVERAGAGRAIAKKRHADIPPALRLGRPGSPGSQRQVSCHDAGCTQDPVGGVHQMHRAAATAAQAVLATENLGQGRLQIAALGQYMPMAAVTGEQDVLVREVRTHAHGHRFLAGGQVRKTRYLARSREPLHLVFEQADAPHGAVHLLPIAQSRCGHVGPRGLPANYCAVTWHS